MANCVSVHFRSVTIAMIFTVIITASGVGSSNVSAAYQRFDTDTFRFWDSSGRSVWVQGTMGWFVDGTVVRGQVDRGSYVILNRQGCLWVRIVWTKLGGDVSWPPSGTLQDVGDGWYRHCEEAGTYVWLDGLAHPSRLLQGAKLCIGYSFYGTYTLRRFDACHGMAAGGR